jgi:drug/metabolite transporter (DMT)-like permease
MTTQTLRAVGLLVVAVLFSVTGELLLKHGMNQIGVLGLSNLLPSLGRMARSPHILGGFASIAVGALFWLAVLSRVDLSFAYPMLSLGYVLVLVFSAVFLKEHVSWVRWMGTLLIIAGVVLISRS